MPQPDNRPWTSIEDAVLGVLTDVEAAAVIDCTPHQARTRRISLGVPPARTNARNPMAAPDPTPPGGRRGPPKREWPPELIALLGKVTDADWAAKAGVSKQRAAQIRERLGIAARGRQPAEYDGRKVGSATVLTRLSKNVFRFRCRCGRTFERKSGLVGDPVCGKCGPCHGRDLAGYQWELDNAVLTAVRFRADLDNRNGAFWDFHCSRCGAIKPLRASNVKGRRQKTCGCLLADHYNRNTGH